MRVNCVLQDRPDFANRVERAALQCDPHSCDLDALDRLIARLDALDGDPDLEAETDLCDSEVWGEPSLGWTENIDQTDRGAWGTSDLEFGDADRERVEVAHV